MDVKNTHASNAYTKLHRSDSDSFYRFSLHQIVNQVFSQNRRQHLDSGIQKTFNRSYPNPCYQSLNQSLLRMFRITIPMLWK